MRSAILKRFVLVLFMALCMNSAIFYVTGSKIILGDTRQSMEYTLRILDSMLDYEKGLKAQIDAFKEIKGTGGERLTLIDMQGFVLADTDANADEMENHLDREEVLSALETGEGFAVRRSTTLARSMLYVACRSSRADLILRLSLPYSGFSQYLGMFLPACLFSFLVALIVSALLTTGFVNSVTRPLSEIAGEMLKVKGDYTDLHFKRSPYPEINVIADTTMKMSENVKAYLNQIEKEKQIRQEFFSNASHELKTPITSIQGYAELLESGMCADEELRVDFAGRIRKEAVNMTGLINDILMISRLEAKEADVPLVHVRISPLVEDIVESFQALAALNGVFIHLDCQPVSVMANTQQMNELFSNLISNAIKYNRPGGEVWVNVRGKGGILYIRIRDNGMGIPEDSLDRIFERFYRVDKGRSRKMGGTGLGLSIVKHIVNYNQGTIRVRSKLDVGTEFSIILPLTSVLGNEEGT